MKSIWLDTRWGCGLVTVDDRGIIVMPTAPIFKKLRGQVFAEIVERGRYYNEYGVRMWEELK